MVDAICGEGMYYLDKPFAFFGHSMGAIVAFEVARQLEKKTGATPAHLVVSGRRAPQLPSNQPPAFGLPDEEFKEKLERLNGVPKELLLSAELMSLVLPSIRSDFEAIETYQYSPGPKLHCPITAFGGFRDSHVSQSSLDAWKEQTTASFKVRMFPGDHFFIHGAERDVLRMLSKDL